MQFFRGNVSSGEPSPFLSRALDGAESLSYECQKQRISNVCSWATVTSEIPLEKDILYQSLAMLAQRQPMLRATIVEPYNDGKKYYKCTDEPVKIDLKVVDKGLEDYIAVAEEIFDTIKFNNDGPLWKAFLLRQDYDTSSKIYTSVIGFVFSHSIADGRSSIIFVQQLVAHLNAIVKETAPTLEGISSFPILPSSTTLLAHKVGWSIWQKLFLMPQIYSALIRTTLYAQSLIRFVNPVLAGFPTIEHEARIIKPATKMLPRIIPAIETTTLVKRCKMKDSTVTGAIAASCHIAFCHILLDRPYSKDAANDMTIAVSARPYHSPQVPAEYIGNHIASLNFHIPLTKEGDEFWELARKCSDSIKADIQQGKHLRFISVLEAAGEALFAQVLHQGGLTLAERRSSGHSVSNAGQFIEERQNDDVYHLGNAWFAAASHRMFGTFANYIVTVNGQLNWVICYDESIISAEIARKYSDFAWQTLKAAIKE